MNSVLITGATSFIGVHLIQEYLDNSYEVYAVIRPNSKNVSRLPQNHHLHIVELEMSDYERIPELIDQADVFIHLAWDGVRAPQRDDAIIQEKNYNCAVIAMYAAVNLKSRVFLCSGSQAEYGITDGDVDENYPCHPITEYGKKKLLAYNTLADIAEKSGMRFVWVRIFSLYGEFDYSNTLIMSTLSKMIQNEEIRLTQCSQIWDFLHVEDASRAILKLTECHQASGIYNIASGIKRPLKEFVQKMREVSYSKSEMMFGAVPYGVGGPVDLRPNINKLYETGWRPRISFEQGIERLLANIRETIVSTKILKKELGAYLLAPKLINDQRGWFEIPFSVQDLQALGLEWRSTFQLNHSFTTYKGTVRGPNYQEEPYDQAKVIRCVKGRLYSVGIELDRNSENFGKFVGFELSAENKYLMYLPKTYAHGFVTLEDGTELEYLTDNEYNYESAKSIKWDELGIDWTVGGQVEVLTDVMSDKNKNAPKLK